MAINMIARLRRCDDSKLEVPFGKNNYQTIIDRLKIIVPKGTTPIAYSLEQAAHDFPSDHDARNIIIVITDGLESCDGDPCAVSLELQKKGIFLKPFIIGIGMDKKFVENFGCMGTFFDASNIHEFKKALNTAMFQTLGKTTVSVELLGINNQPTETNVNISFINSFTKISSFEFVHYRDENGKPDSVEIDPVLSYDIVANTIPPVTRQNVQFEAGKHNVIRLKTPQGTLQLEQPGSSEYENGVKALIRKSGENQVLTVIDVPGETKLLVGQYDIEYLTLPRKIFHDCAIEQSIVKSLKLQQPGVINITTTANGIGSLYELLPDGSQQWIYNLNGEKRINTMAIQPGSYKVVFRSEKAKGSKFTVIRKFEIRPGSSLTINL